MWSTKDVGSPSLWRPWEEAEPTPPTAQPAQPASDEPALSRWPWKLTSGAYWCTPDTEHLLVPTLLKALVRSPHYPAAQGLVWRSDPGSAELGQTIHEGSGPELWYVSGSDRHGEAELRYGSGVITRVAAASPDRSPGACFTWRAYSCGQPAPHGFFAALARLLPPVGQQGEPTTWQGAVHGLRAMVFDQLAQHPDLLAGLDGVRLVPPRNAAARQASGFSREAGPQTSAQRVSMRHRLHAMAPRVPVLFEQLGSRRQVALALAVSGSTVQKYFQEDGRPTWHALQRWSDMGLLPPDLSMGTRRSTAPGTAPDRALTVAGSANPRP